MKKILIYMLMGLVMVGFVTPLSDPINQTYSEYNNLTKADNVLEVTQEINNWIGGLFGIGIIVIMAFMLFGLSQFFTTSISTQFLFTGFFLSVIAVFLRVMNLLSDLPFYIILSFTIIGVAVKVFSGQ